MAKVIQISDPPRADHRIIRYLLETMDKKVQHLPEEYNRVVEAFSQAGGSWQRVFLGSVSDVALLKKIIKHAIKSGVMSKTPKWS